VMILFNEFMRRFQEMNMTNQLGETDMLKNHTIIINNQNETIKKIVKFAEMEKNEEVDLLVKYIHNLALLEQKRFTGKELKDFIEISNNVLKLIK